MSWDKDTIIITGATGFIGSAVLWELNQSGENSVVISDHIQPEKHLPMMKGLSYRDFIPAVQLREQLKLDQAPPCRALIHMGACSDTTETDKSFLEDNNTEFTKDLFRYCTRSQSPFIFASSGAVYGDGAQGFDDQTSPELLIPLNLYGWSKLNFDQWILKETHLPPSWYGLRFFNVFGPNENFKNHMASLVFKAYQQILETGQLKLFRSHHPDYKDGEQVRDFVYVKEISAWIKHLVLNPKTPNGIYNMGFGQTRTWLDLAQAVFSAMGVEQKIEWIDIPESIRDQYQYKTEAKMDSWIQATELPPHWDLEESVRDYVLNYLKTEHPFLTSKGSN